MNDGTNKPTGNNPPSKDPLLIDHEADGIEELDNLLPRWWVWLFYITTIFAVVYSAVCNHVLKKGDSQVAEYTKEAQAGEAIKSASLAKFESSISSLTPSKDAAVLAKGQQGWDVQMCSPCHSGRMAAVSSVRTSATPTGLTAATTWTT